MIDAFCMISTQEGVGLDGRYPSDECRLMRRGTMSARAYLVLRSVLVSNTVLLLAVAVLLAGFMQWPAGVIGAAIACVVAGMSLGAARWTDWVYEHRR
jgi:hypothetical protein